jgi:hypothetical protein
VASAGLKGTVPRSDADISLPCGTQRPGRRLLTSDQAHKKFSVNMNRCCVVAEVAFCPEKDKPVDVLLDDFSLQPVNADYSARPTSLQIVAARLEPPSNR